MASPGDARLERILANVLWTGVVASSLSLAVGLVLTLASGGAASGPWLTIGLLTLMATPDSDRSRITEPEDSRRVLVTGILTFTLRPQEAMTRA